jgi:hypothetical protein
LEEYYSCTLKEQGQQGEVLCLVTDRQTDRADKSYRSDCGHRRPSVVGTVPGMSVL